MLWKAPVFLPETFASADEMASSKLLSLVEMMALPRDKVPSSASTHVPIFSKSIIGENRAVCGLLRMPIVDEVFIDRLSAKWADSALTVANETPLRKKDSPLSTSDIARIISYGIQVKNTNFNWAQPQRKKISEFGRELQSMCTLTSERQSMKMHPALLRETDRLLIPIEVVYRCVNAL